MNTARLLEHFHRIGEASDAIPRLRRFILDLAVRGKLVPQNPNDEPASALLKRIALEKARMLKDRRSGSSEKIVSVDGEAAPFSIPLTWAWASFGDVVISRDGERIPVSKEERSGRAKIYDYYGASGVIDKIDNYLFDKPLLLIGEDGANLINRSTPIAFIARGKYWVNNHAHVLDGISEGFLRYLELFINAIDLKPYVTGTAQPKMNQAKMNSIPVALPPLAEQQRIVAKVDALMALCDRLEAARQEREAARDRLAAASLARLDAPDPDPATFAGHAHFALDNLAALTARPDQVKELRQNIIGLAVFGKLTADWRHEHPNACDAAEIAARLEEAHKRNGGHRRGNAAAATEGVHDLNAKDLPKTWQLTDLRTAVHPDRPITYGILMPGPDTPGGIPYIRVADFPNDRLNLATIRRTTKEIESIYARARLQPGDILVSIRGTVGRVCIVPKELQDANITQDTARLSIQPSLDTGFVMWFLRSPHAQQRMRNCSKGVAVRGINIGDVRALQLPVPPIAEQRRIVAVIEKLMALCDRLEASLATRDTTSRRLLDALLAEALTPAKDVNPAEAARVVAHG